MSGAEKSAPDACDTHQLNRSCSQTTLPGLALHVLIVDNETRFVEMLRGLLEIDGHQVVSACDPSTAISLAEHERLDVAIVDLSMPTMNGWRLAEELRRRQADVGIILCTGWGREIADASDERSRVDVILEKPFRLRDLREALQEAYQLVTGRHRSKEDT
jgi:CheY-like chemotaxis protein